MAKKLNLGCGKFKKAGYVNVDINPLVKPDILMNLNDAKEYKKFKNNEFDEVVMEHVMEHLDDPFSIMKELHRILKKGGKLTIKVPHFSRAFTHPQHKAGFDVSFPLYFDKTFTGGYYGVDFKSLKTKLRWMIRFDLKKQVTNVFVLSVARVIDFIINIFANISPYFCSRFWCYLVGGFEEIEFQFEKI